MFGGTVEKSFGDDVLAIFGAPIAHEDDPERAVRAALSIPEPLAEGGELEGRIGVTTGEALVALDGRPETGEGMASGDVINTAARLHSAPPTGFIPAARPPTGRRNVVDPRQAHRESRRAGPSTFAKIFLFVTRPRPAQLAVQAPEGAFPRPSSNFLGSSSRCGFGLLCFYLLKLLGSAMIVDEGYPRSPGPGRRLPTG